MYSIVHIFFGDIKPHPALEHLNRLEGNVQCPDYDRLFTEAGIAALCDTAFLQVVKTGRGYLVINGLSRWQALFSIGASPSQPVSCIVLPTLSSIEMIKHQTVETVLWPALTESNRPTLTARIKTWFRATEQSYPDQLARLSGWRKDRGGINASFIEKIFGKCSGTINRSPCKR